MARFLNRLRVILDQNITASNAIDKAFKAHPDSILFHPDQELPYKLLPGNAVSVRSLHPFVNRVGNLLIRSGLKKYDRVAIYKKNSPDYFFLGLAIIKAGGICVPVNPGMTSEQISHYLSYTGSRMVFTDKETFREKIQDITKFPLIDKWFFPDMPAELIERGVDLNKELDGCSPQLEPVLLHNDSAVLIVHTSGTTGFPKGVICTSGSIIAGVKGHFRSEPVSTNNRIGIAGFYNHLVYYVGFYTSLLGNFTSYTLDKPDARSALSLIEKHKINIFFAFSDVYMKMYCEGLEKYNLNSIKIWIATADASHEAHIQAFLRHGAYLKFSGKKLMGPLFIDVIGTSEVGSGAIRRIYFPFFRPEYKRQIGLPVPGGVSVKIADENGRKLPAGKPGRLMVKGKTVFKGYWNAHEMLNGVVLDGWWWTGDIAVRDRIGRIYHLDRSADMFMVNGKTIYTLLVEEKLLSHPDVGEAVVIGINTSANEKIPVAIIQPRPDRTIHPDEFIKWADKKIGAEIKLRQVIIAGEKDIPRGLTGKVLKRILRERYHSALIPS